MSLGHHVGKLVADHDSGLTGKAAHWERVPLREIAAVVNGFPFPSDRFNNAEGSPVLRIRDILPGKIGTFYNGPIEDASTVELGELVVGMDGNFNCRLWLGERALLNQRVCKVISRESLYSNRLLSYVLPAYLKLINDHTSAVTVKHLSSKDIEDVPIPLPPRKEQERLASKIDELFSSIDEGERALERVRKLVERYRQSVLKAAVTGELTREWREQHAGELESGEALLTRILEARRQAWEQSELAKMTAKGIRPTNDSWKKKYKSPAPLNVSDLPELPTGWAWVSLDTLGDIVGGITVDQKRDKDGCESVPYLRVANVQRGYLDLSHIKMIDAPKDEIRQLTLRMGDILFNEGGDIDKLGRGWIWEEQHSNCIHQNHVFRARLFVPGKWNKIISWYCNVLGRKLFTELGKQTTNLASLSLSKLKQVAIPLMSAAEAEQIVSQVETLESGLGKEFQELSLSSALSSGLRQSVLQSAFSGQLVPQDPTDEPASILLERIAAERAAAPKRTSAKQTRTKKTKSKAKA